MNKKDLKKLFPLLHALRGVGKDRATHVLPFLNDDAHRAICACIHNCLFNEKVPIRRRKMLKKKLFSKRHVYRYLSRSNADGGKRRKLMPQIGGSLSLILGTVLPLIANLLFPKVFGK